MRGLSGRFKVIWKNQKGRCFHCGMLLDIRDNREIFFKILNSKVEKNVLIIWRMYTAIVIKFILQATLVNKE